LSSDTAIAELRLTTRADHDRIEQILRLDQPMALERYAAIMAGFDAFLRAWEPRIHDALPERLQPWFRPRRRGGFASADLEWLRDVAGIEPPDYRAPMAAALPLIDLSQVLGSLYVIEGLALDGRVVAPRLKRTLGLDQGRGASHFHGFGGDTGVMWANFRVLASLEIGDSPRETVRACQSARRTFAALFELFAPLDTHPRPTAAAAAPPAHIAPALMATWGTDDDDPDATRPAPLDDGHVDLPVDDEPDEGDTVIELPLDELGDDAVHVPL
jgi:heme oxygenase (biliverdin-IX-beta and delta-forming)